ncbi:MAG: LLM class flavin-dependent oxidoreductase [Chloroflexota bacterium]|nr:LLM class flavin-dependent oxidoreductase [Chloroflexota bacterium]
MRFGLYLNQYFHAPMRSVHAELAEQAAALEESGWDFLALGEGHLRGAGFQEQLTTLAWLAGKTQRLGICSAGFILPLYDPVMLAEQLANLDQLSDGRLICGVVLGYREEEFAMSGVPRAERAMRLEAGLHVITRLWSGAALDGTNPLFPRPGARLSVLPAQQPRPPTWIGAHVRSAIERAARLGDGWIASANASASELAEKVGWFAGAAEAAGTRGEGVLMRDGFVADSAEEARRIVERPLLGLYAEYAGWKRDSPDAAKYFTLHFDDLRPKLVLGSPEECVDQLRAYRDLGVDAVIMRMQYPGLAQADLLRAIRRFGSEVIPPLRDA